MIFGLETKAVGTYESTSLNDMGHNIYTVLELENAVIQKDKQNYYAQFESIAEAPLTFADKVYIESELANGRWPKAIHNGAGFGNTNILGFTAPSYQEYGASALAFVFVSVILVAYLWQLCRRYYNQAAKQGLNINVADEWDNPAAAAMRNQ